MNSIARITCDASGRPWLLFRHRQEVALSDVVANVGGVWLEYATCLAGNAWTPPQPLPRSDGLLDNRPAPVATPDGPVLAFYNTDNRMHREIEIDAALKRTYVPQRGSPPGVADNDLFVAALAIPAALDRNEPVEGLRPIAPTEPVAAVHPDEAADVARIRSYRVEAGGKSYRLLRGEFHRHSELSWDGANDGTLEDMWRYAIDAASLDWIGNGDHDNGGGKEYSWWLVQKTTDLYHNAPAFIPMFTYERSVIYPGGHRNVMFPYRGVRTLPRLVDETGGVKFNENDRDLDAQMLYRYLKELGGICAAHTSGTSMGTDWRENDPQVEPVVEIYQGARDSVRTPRRAARPARAGRFRGRLEAIGRGLERPGHAVQARLRVVERSRLDPYQLRRRAGRGAHPPGDLQRHQAAPLLRRDRQHRPRRPHRRQRSRHGRRVRHQRSPDPQGRRRGTSPIKRVDIIKDFVYVYSTEPNSEQVAFTWTETLPDRGGASNGNTSWYYVRVEQADGELAWASPMWVNRRR